MNKKEVLKVLNDLQEEVQYLRENGENDLRSVLSLISDAYEEVNNM